MLDRDTPSEPHGPAVAPGVYTLKLTVNGKTYTQTLNVRMDPRVVTPPLGLAQQFALSMQAYDGSKTTFEVLTAIRNLRRQSAAVREKTGAGALTDALMAFEKKLSELDGSGARPAPGAPQPASLGKLNGDFLTLLNLLQDADATPTTQVVKAMNGASAALKPLLAHWETVKNTDLPALNKLLRANGQPVLQV